MAAVPMALAQERAANQELAVEQTADHSLSVLNQPSHRLKKLTYRHDEPILGYAVASKRSEKQKLIEQVQVALLNLAKSGELSQIVDLYDLPPVVVK